MRNPRTGGRWQRVLGLALVLTLTLMSPLSVSADAGTNVPVTPGAGTETSRPSGTRVVSQDVNMRTSASLDSFVITVIQTGSTVTLTGNLLGQFAEISFGDATGWVDAEFLLEGVSGTATPTSVAATQRTLADDVNLREAPNAESGVLAVLPRGGTVNVTGAVSDSFAKVTSAKGTGWVAAQFLLETAPGTGEPTPSSTVASTQTLVSTAVSTETPMSTSTSTVVSTTTPETPGSTETPVGTVTATGTAIAPTTVVPTQTATSSATETPMPSQTVPDKTETVQPTETTAPQPTQTPAVMATSGQIPTAPQGSSQVVWPVKGGTWTISQGYNGSSHQDNNDLWQYLYSFDIVPNSGDAAGQPVYSPVNGTIKWFDPSTGGISIDMGGGLAFAMFHMDVDANLQVGQTLKQGDHVGTIAPPGGGGNGGFPHLHITAWSTSDGGNWDRHAIPFTGAAAISGRDFPSDGSSQQYTGVTFTP
ncbi:MAG: SH3 domain-containing protein [Thermomicrobiales bacterium]